GVCRVWPSGSTPVQRKIGLGRRVGVKAELGFGWVMVTVGGMLLCANANQAGSETAPSGLTARTANTCGRRRAPAFAFGNSSTCRVSVVLSQRVSTTSTDAGSIAYT